jgi:hypothetical protein
MSQSHSPLKAEELSKAMSTTRKRPSTLRKSPLKAQPQSKSMKKLAPSSRSPPAKRRPAWNSYLTDLEQYRLPKDKVLEKKKGIVSHSLARAHTPAVLSESN